MATQHTPWRVPEEQGAGAGPSESSCARGRRGRGSRLVPVACRSSVPVLVHRAEMPTPEQLPVRIRELAFRQASQVRGDPDFPADVGKLLRLLSSKKPMSPHDATHPTLSVVSGPNKGKHFPLDKERVLIGRNRRCDICIEGGFASEYHAAIVCVTEGLFCRDIGPKNGTVVNGLRVPSGGQVPLHDGDLRDIP